MRIGIDLLWVRVGICGGTESFIRNLLDGFVRYEAQHEYVLFVAEDNADSFRHYAKNSCAALHVCQVKCANQMKRIFWENLFLAKEAEREKADVMFVPVYSKPSAHGSKIPYVSVIHDLQALHYPEYFSFVKRLFLKYAWRKTCKTSNRIIAISNFVKEDIEKHFSFAKGRVCTIYNPIISKASGLSGSYIEEKYGIKAGNYFYCVSSLLPHKNLFTILKVMKKRKECGRKEEKLVLSGVGGNRQKIEEQLSELGIRDSVIFTGFISDEERDCLYENCRLFLFPSVFEGFGMPPIEAMRKGKNVVMTEKTCLKEVTDGKAIYVQNPYDVEEWNAKIEEAQKTNGEVREFEQYELENVAQAYMETFIESQKDDI